MVKTRGEPLLQLDTGLIHALHARGFKIAVETNGTVAPPEGIDWLCVSPKRDSRLVVHAGQEIKRVYPQAGGDPQQFAHMAFENFYLQPMDGPTAADRRAPRGTPGHTAGHKCGNMHGHGFEVILHAQIASNDHYALLDASWAPPA